MIYRHINVTDEDGRIAAIDPVPADKTPEWAANVKPDKAQWSAQQDNESPYFKTPIPFVVPPKSESCEPFYKHNHCPAITWCENGDLLAAWFSTQREKNTEMTILASRLRAGADHWDESAEFFKAPDRNMTGTALLHDGNGTLYHFNGMGPENVEGWANLALLMRTSTDNGISWTAPLPISSGEHYQSRHQVIAGTNITPHGHWIQPCDGTHRGEGPTAVHISRDNGNTWTDPGGDIRGIHAGVVGLNDGRLLAFGRAQAIEEGMPMSISEDMGRTWTYHPSPFPPIGSAQRLVLMRLREGPLLLVSFTHPARHVAQDQWQGMSFTDANGDTFRGYGIFAALSFDEGETWPARKLLTPEKGTYNGGGHTGDFTVTANMGEPLGYLAATQTPDGIIHLISSRLHYRFNMTWVLEPTAMKSHS